VVYGDKEFHVATSEIFPNTVDAYVIHGGYVIEIGFTTSDNKAVSDKQKEEFNKVLMNLNFID